MPRRKKPVFFRVSEVSRVLCQLHGDNESSLETPAVYPRAWRVLRMQNMAADEFE